MDHPTSWLAGLVLGAGVVTVIAMLYIGSLNDKMARVQMDLGQAEAAYTIVATGLSRHEVESQGLEITKEALRRLPEGLVCAGIEISRMPDGTFVVLPRVVRTADLADDLWRERQRHEEAVAAAQDAPEGGAT